MECKHTFRGGHSESILCADHDAISGFVATGGESGELCLWDASGHVLQKTLVDPDCDCTSICFTRKEPGTLFAAVGSKVFRFSCSNLQTPVHTFACNSDEVNQIALDSSERYLAACDDSGEVKIIDVKKKKLYKTLRKKHANICSSIYFHPSCTTDLFSGGMDQKLVHWIYPQHRAQASYNMVDILAKQQDASGYMVNPPLVYHLDMSPEGQHLVCGLQSGHVAVFNSSQRDLQLLFVMKAHEEGVAQVRFVTERLLVTGGNDALIRLWNLSRLSQEGGKGEGVEGCNSTFKQPGMEVKKTGSANAKTTAHHNGTNALGTGKTDAAVKSGSESEEFLHGEPSQNRGACMHGSASVTEEESSRMEVGGGGRALDDVPQAADGAGTSSSLAQSLGESVQEQGQGAASTASTSSCSDEQPQARLLLSFKHSSKINWLVPFRENGETCLAVADQSSVLTILKLPVF